MLLPAHSSAPSGSTSAERGERQPLERLVARLHGRQPVERGRGRRPGPPRTSRAPSPIGAARPLASSASASAVAVAVASACTKVVGRIAGSLQPRSPSTTIWAGRASVSRVSIGFEVVVAPKRTTRSGTVRVAPGPGPDEVVRVRQDVRCGRGARADAGERIRDDREAGRGGESGERRGQGRVVLRAGDDEPARGRGADGRPGPRWRRARARVARRSPRRRAPRGDFVRSVGRERHPARHVGMSGSRNGMLRWTGPAGEPDATGDRPTDHRPDVAARLRLAIEQRQVDRPAHLRAEDPDLVDRLGRAPLAQLGRPIGGQHHQRDPRHRRLDDGRQQVGDGRPGGHDDRDRAARRPGQAEREEPGCPLVEHDPDASGPDALVRRGRAASSATPGRRRPR